MSRRTNFRIRCPAIPALMLSRRESFLLARLTGQTDCVIRCQVMPALTRCDQMKRPKRLTPIAFILRRAEIPCPAMQAQMLWIRTRNERSDSATFFFGARPAACRTAAPKSGAIELSGRVLSVHRASTARPDVVLLAD